MASRVMAVCDVYDALTAMDRPYKPAVSVDTAFRILHEEAVQADALFSEAVDGRCLDDGIAGAAKRVVTQMVRRDEEDIRCAQWSSLC